MFNKSTQATTKSVLRDNPSTRNNDKNLILKVWQQEGFVLTSMQIEQFLEGVSTPDSITRAKRNLQSQGFYRPDGISYEIRKGKADNIRANFKQEREIPAEIDKPRGNCPSCDRVFMSEQHLAKHITLEHK